MNEASGLSEVSPTSSNSPNSREPAKKKRLFYLDFVRALSVLLILLTHFNNPFFTASGWIITNHPFHIYVGDLGVSMFLMISGTALTVTYRRPLDLKLFFKKRFLGIYPMFWIAYAVFFTLRFLVYRANVGPLPYRSFPLTIMAMDGLVANFGVPTMYLLGEWFLGFIVIFYLVFPLMLWGVQEHPWATAVLGLGIYAAAMIFWQLHPLPYSTAVLLPFRIPELLFGMYFATYWKKVSPWALIPAVGILILAVFCFAEVPDRLAVTLVGISAFTVLVFIGKYLEVWGVTQIVNWISKYSYAIFLVHHVIIAEAFNRFPIQDFSQGWKYVAFLVLCLLSGAVGFVLFHVHRLIMSLIRKIRRQARSAS